MNLSLRQWLLVFVLFLTHKLNAQDYRPSSLIPKLDQMQLDYLNPVEAQFKIKKSGKTHCFSYDALLRSKKEKQEIFVMLNPEVDNFRYSTTPHLEFTRLIASMASNDQTTDIQVIFFESDKLNKKNADWGAEVYFELKANVSLYSKAKLISFFSEGHGLVNILYCYEDDANTVFPELFEFQDRHKNPSEINDGL